MADLRTDIVAGDIGHPGIHNATNAAVNALAARLDAMSETALPVLRSDEDTSSLPVGAVYGVYDPPAAASPTVRGWATGHLESLTAFTVTPGAPGGFQTGFGGDVPQAGDLVIVTMLVKDPNNYPGLSWTAPAGFTQLPTIAAQGTMQPWIWVGAATGPGAMSWVSSIATSVQYAAVWISGAASPGDVVQGIVKRRTDQPTETTTVTCPSTSASAFSLAVSIAFERTAAAEATSPSWSSGWTSTVYGQDPDTGGDTDDLLTTCVAVKTMVTSGATGDAVCSYPNPQANNGLGVQLLIPGAPA